MGWDSMAQVYSPSLSPLPWVRATPRSTPLSGRLGLRVSSVKLKTLNAFYGHFRSFAHPKPYIKNDQRKKIYNPVLIDFRYQKTCLGREEPIKPIDHDLLLKEATRCNGRVLTVEDHYPEDGLGEVVASILAEQRNIIVKILAVREVRRSGPPEVLLEHFGIGAKAIAEAAKKLVAL
jgi:hypothetical protein